MYLLPLFDIKLQRVQKLKHLRRIEGKACEAYSFELAALFEFRLAKNQRVLRLEKADDEFIGIKLNNELIGIQNHGILGNLKVDG